METEPTLVYLTGHKDRQELETLLSLPRKVEPLKDYRMKLALGALGQLLLNSGSLTFPLVDFVKEKFGLKSVETLERMEKELMHLHEELTKAGVCSEDVTDISCKRRTRFH